MTWWTPPQPMQNCERIPHEIVAEILAELPQPLTLPSHPPVTITAKPVTA